MDNFLTDEELDEMFEEEHNPMQTQAAPLAPVQQALPNPEPVPLYDLRLAQVPPQPQQQSAMGDAQQEGLLTKQLGPLPVWAWGLIGLGVAGTGYFGYRTLKPNKKDGDDGDSDSPQLGEIVSKTLAATMGDGGGSSWEPSRSRFVSQLERYFQKKGQSQHVKVWVDADDARKDGGLKFVSPLVNVQVKHGSVKLDQALTRFCRREGLNPKQHPDGSIGLYPHSSKRGKEWEEYIDALRDDGQQT